MHRKRAHRINWEWIAATFELVRACIHIIYRNKCRRSQKKANSNIDSDAYLLWLRLNRYQSNLLRNSTVPTRCACCLCSTAFLGWHEANESLRCDNSICQHNSMKSLAWEIKPPIFHIDDSINHTRTHTHARARALQIYISKYEIKIGHLFKPSKKIHRQSARRAHHGKSKSCGFSSNALLIGSCFLCVNFRDR